MLAKIFYCALVVGITAGSHAWQDVEDYKSAPQPYKYGYEVKDKESAQFRHEESDGSGNVKGSYGYTDDNGIYREVHYVADKNGFRAQVKTNEPGTANQNPADVEIKAEPKYVDVIPQVQIPKQYSPNIFVAPKVEASPERKYLFKKYQDISIPTSNNNQLLNSFNLNTQPDNSFSYNSLPSNSFNNNNQLLNGFSVNTENLKSYNYNNNNQLNGFQLNGEKPAFDFNISPFSGFNYQPLSTYKNYRSYSPINQQKKYRFRVPRYRNLYGLGGEDNISGGYDVKENGNKNDYEKIMREIKKIANSGRFNNAAGNLGSQLDFNQDFNFPKLGYGQQYNLLNGGDLKNDFDSILL